MSHPPLLLSGSKADRSLRNGENGQARPAPPPRGAAGGRREGQCYQRAPREPSGTRGTGGNGGWGGRRPRWRRGAVAEPVPARDRGARGRYQAAAVRRARAVTWLAAGGSARNGGKMGQLGAARLPRGGRRGPGGSREASALLSRERGGEGQPPPGGRPPARPVGRGPPSPSGPPVPRALSFQTPIAPVRRCPGLSPRPPASGLADFQREQPEESQGGEPGLGR